MATVCVSVFTACSNPVASTVTENKNDPLEIKNVRIAYHPNEGGASVIATALERGFFADEGIEIELIEVESGPIEMEQMRADDREIDVGFIGAGVAWNAIDSSGNGVKIIFFDGLSDSETLIARKGQFEDANNNGFYDYNEIYNGLKGKTVYLDKSTTPGGWLKSLLEALNEGRPEHEQLWIHSEIANYLEGYTPPNDDPENAVHCVQLSNNNIEDEMNMSEDHMMVDIAVAFAPVPMSIISANDDVELIAVTSSHLPNVAQPSTWVASEAWIDEDPDAVQRVVNALQNAAAIRGEDPDTACRLAETLCGAEVFSFDPSVALWPTETDLKDWFKAKTSNGYEYMQALYDSKIENVPQGVTPREFEDCFDFTYMNVALNQHE